MFLLCSLDFVGNFYAVCVYVPEVSPLPLETAYLLGCVPWALAASACACSWQRGRRGCWQLRALLCAKQNQSSGGKPKEIYTEYT